MIEIDNSESERTIQTIEVVLRQTITYKTGDLDDPDKGKQVQRHYDLQMLEYGELQAGGTTGELAAKFDIESIAMKQRELHQSVRVMKNKSEQLETVAKTLTS